MLHAIFSIAVISMAGHCQELAADGEGANAKDVVTVSWRIDRDKEEFYFDGELIGTGKEAADHCMELVAAQSRRFVVFVHPIAAPAKPDAAPVLLKPIIRDGGIVNINGRPNEKFVTLVTRNADRKFSIRLDGKVASLDDAISEMRASAKEGRRIIWVEEIITGGEGAGDFAAEDRLTKVRREIGGSKVVLRSGGIVRLPEELRNDPALRKVGSKLGR